MSYSNESTLDRTVRVTLGLLMLAAGWSGLAEGVWKIALEILGWVPLVTGLIGWSPIYMLLDLNTAGRAREPETGPPGSSVLASSDKTPQLMLDLALAEERLRTAGEMQDGLAQVLAYVNTKAQAVKELLRNGRADEASRHLDQLAVAAREVYADVRESIIGLRNATALERSIGEALEDYVSAWQADTGIGCSLRIDGVLQLDANAGLQVLRIVQESLANVRKHAGASRVEVSLEQIDNRLRVTVRDDGTGFDPSLPSHSERPRFGLATIRARTEALGGVFHLDSAPGAGTRVTIELPA